jgi:hypothetical protein
MGRFRTVPEKRKKKLHFVLRRFCIVPKKRKEKKKIFILVAFD